IIAQVHAFDRELVELRFSTQRDFRSVVMLGVAQSTPPVAGVVFGGQRVGNVIRQSVGIGVAGGGVEVSAGGHVRHSGVNTVGSRGVERDLVDGVFVQDGRALVAVGTVADQVPRLFQIASNGAVGVADFVQVADRGFR